MKNSFNLYKKWLDENEFHFFYKKIYENPQWLCTNIANKDILKLSLYGSKDFEIKKLFPRHKALPYTGELLALKQLVEIYTEQKYNSCLIIHSCSNDTTNFLPHSLLENMQENGTSIAFVCLNGKNKLSINNNIIDLYNGDLVEYTENLSKNTPLVLYCPANSFSLLFLKLKPIDI